LHTKEKNTPTPQLRDAILHRERYITLMATWPWAKTARHLDLIDRQLAWAFEQRNENAISLLEERRNQVVTARLRKLDNEQATD